MGELSDSMHKVLPLSEYNAFVDEMISYTETNKELAYLGSAMLVRALNILSTTCPPEALRKAIDLHLAELDVKYLPESTFEK